MAASKVDVRPPPTLKAQWSFADTPPSMSGLNAISSPKLFTRRFRTATPSLTSYFNPKPPNSHIMYKAASFPPSDSLVANFCRSEATDIDRTAPLLRGGHENGVCCENQESSQKATLNPMFGLFGVFSFSPFSSINPLNSQSGLGMMGLVNTHQISHPPPLLNPYHSTAQTRNLVKETLLVPGISHFEAESENRKECTGVVNSKGVNQLGEHGALLNSKSAVEPSARPFVNLRPVASKLIPEEGRTWNDNDLLCCPKTTCHKAAMSGDDEIQTAFHTSLNEIHGTSNCDTSSECCFLETRGDNDCASGDRETTGNPEASNQPTHPKCTHSDSHSVPKVDHLVIDSCRELRKLPSDESGFYETSSPSEAPPADLNSWWQRSVELSCDDDDDMEWDDEEDYNEDDACEATESADDLWKSFEEGILSPQCLMAPAVKPKSPPSSLSPRSPHSLQIPRSQQTQQAKHELEFGTISFQTPLSAELEHTAESGVVDDRLTSEQCCAGQTEHNTDHRFTPYPNSPDSNGASSDTSSAEHTNNKSRQVRFADDSEISVVHEMVVWNYAYRAARKGPWEQCARDRAHFRRRIENLASVLEPCLRSKAAKMAIL